MYVKNVAYVLSLVLVFSFFGYFGVALGQTGNVSLQGVGVTVDLAFPLEAHPTDSTIWHNITITASVGLKLENFTISIWAPINSVYTLVKSQPLPEWSLDANEPLPYRLSFTLPQNTNGSLRCLLYFKTDQSSDYASFAIYTTQVRAISYGELVAMYNELLANHSSLVTQYENLLEQYNELFSENVALISSHEALLAEHNALKANYTSLLDSQRTLQSGYDELEASYEGLLTNFSSLNSAHTILQGNYSELESQIGDLKEEKSSLEGDLTFDRMIMLIFLIAVVGLIALIVYVKRRKQEPYLVIRKETSVLGEENKE